MGVAVLGYDYGDRRALLHDPGPGQVSPHLYVLCAPCAERLTPPRGWTLEDERSEPPLFLEQEPTLPAIDVLEPPLAEPEEVTTGRQLFFGQSA